MTLLLALAVGVMYATGLYMMLRRSFVKLIIGLALIGHGANLLIWTSAGIVRGEPPLIEPGQTELAIDPAIDPEATADPLPFALILTAIVISFAIVSYTIVLVKRTYQEVGTDDLDDMRTTDR